MTKGSGLSMAAAVAALLLIGMVFGASLWVLAAYAAFSIVGANLYLSKHWHQSLLAIRASSPIECEVGRSITVRIEITNQSTLPVAWVLVEDLLPAGAYRTPPAALSIQGSRTEVMFLWAKQTRVLQYELTCHRRGYYQIGPTVLETGDLMGLSRRYRLGTQPQFLLVLPTVTSLSGYDIASPRPIGEIKIRDALIQDPTRMMGIRQWQLGDPMRTVHWPATARTGVLHTKLFEPTTLAGATIVIDLHRDTNPRNQEPVRSDLAISLAASLAAMLHEKNEPFALLTNGRDAVDRIRQEGIATDFRTRDAAKQSGNMKESDDRLRPVILNSDRGAIHFQEYLRQLARLELSDGLDISQTLINSQSRLAHDSTLIVILAQSNDRIATTLINMKRRGWELFVIINTFDLNSYFAAAGPYQSANIPTVQLKDEQTLPHAARAAVFV